MGHSHKCSDLTTYWDRTTSACVNCSVEPGREITPNCGFDDNGGQHEPPTRKCKNDYFNNGSWAYCQRCTPCPPGYDTESPCNLTTDTKCNKQRHETTTESTTSRHVATVLWPTSTLNASSLTPNATTTPTALNPAAASHVLWAVPLAFLLFLMLVLSACVFYMKRKRGQRPVLSYNRRSSYINSGFSPLPSAPGNNDLQNILSPDLLSAPLKNVLDNLDVLEELVILLDPEGHGVKNTKHLASHCSFPSTWITYTYSMKDSKSPLKAVLEGVTSRHPDWTVGHLAKLLRQMERNDAVAVLTKLRLNQMDMDHSFQV